MSPANIRTSSTMCWRGRRICSRPRALHPIFFGSFDWHSCVHGYWLLLRRCGGFPGHAGGRRHPRLADEASPPDKVAGELAYLDRAYTRRVRAALRLGLAADAPCARRSATTPRLGRRTAPLAEAFADRFRAFLPKPTYPIRTGTHFNTAFALALARDWAAANDPALAALIARAGARLIMAATATARPGSPPATTSSRRR